MVCIYPQKPSVGKRICRGARGADGQCKSPVRAWGFCWKLVKCSQHVLVGIVLVVVTSLLLMDHKVPKSQGRSRQKTGQDVGTSGASYPLFPLCPVLGCGWGWAHMGSTELVQAGRSLLRGVMLQLVPEAQHHRGFAGSLAWKMCKTIFLQSASRGLTHPGVEGWMCEGLKANQSVTSAKPDLGHADVSLPPALLLQLRTGCGGGSAVDGDPVSVLSGLVFVKVFVILRGETGIMLLLCYPIHMGEVGSRA